MGITTTRYVLEPAAGLTQVLADGANTCLYGNGDLAQYQTAMQSSGADGLGSMRQLYDASGQVAATNRYDPYGDLMSQISTAPSVFGFTGEQWDAATGLEYLRTRYYSPSGIDTPLQEERGTRGHAWRRKSLSDIYVDRETCSVCIRPTLGNEHLV